MRAILGALAAPTLSRCHAISSSHSLPSMTGTWAPSGAFFFGAPPRQLLAPWQASNASRMLVSYAADMTAIRRPSGGARGSPFAELFRVRKQMGSIPVFSL